MARLVAHGAFSDGAPQLFGLRTEFLLFALTLFGVALLHKRTLEVAVSGLGAIVLLKFLTFGSAFDLPGHLRHEAVILINLFGLLIGFAILARHFEQSRVPAILPGWLPDDRKGGFVLLVMVFLLSLVLAASLMPVEELPPASWTTALELGFISAVFDNIPLTKLALDQGDHDWGFSAYAIGFGGSTIWFGSSTGVALPGLVPKARSVGARLRRGGHVVVAYRSASSCCSPRSAGSRRRRIAPRHR